MHEARKTVTILFADVVASTELAERLDPEALRGVASRYFAEMADVVEHHGGTVEKFIGDEVMAVFGVPTVHEDDALRAVRAAASMHERLHVLNEELEATWGAHLEIRIGVNSGEVVAGDPSSGHGFVTGSAVNVAKRLEQAAEPGEILLGDATHRLVRHAVETTPVGKISLRGKRDAASPRRLDEVRAEAEALARRFDAPLVGRRGELARLHAAYAHAVEARRGQLLTLLGSAGIGKSRLVRELLTQVSGEADVAVARCPPYGEGLTFLPVRQILPDERLDGTNDVVFRRVRTALERRARQQPLVVCFDDVHWGEPTFLDLVQYLAGWIRDAPVLLLCLGRPELLERRPDWLHPQENAEALLLGALKPESIRQLLGELDAPAAALDRIVEAAEGNPLFVEQFAALAAEQEGDLTVPPSIRALLSARLNLLTAEEASVVERASVIGRDFALPGVVDLLDEELRTEASRLLLALVRKELIRPHHAGDDDCFRFRHALIRDAAYEAISKGLRSDLHERHAVWLADGSGDDAVVGYHLEQAATLRRSLGRDDARTQELASRAAALLGAAGKGAVRRDDVPAATTLLRRAEALLPRSADVRAPVLLDLASVLMKSGRLADAEAALDDALDAARARGDRRTELRAVVERAQLHAYTAPAETAGTAQLSSEVIPELERLGDHLGLAKAWRLFSGIHVAACRWRERAEALEQALDHARRVPDAPQERSSIVAVLVQALYFGPVAAADAEARCRAFLPADEDDPALRAAVASHLSGLVAMQGRLEEARRTYAEGAALHEELGLRFRRAVLALVGAEVAVLDGDGAGAERELRAAYGTLEAMGESGARSAVAAVLADLLCTAGDDQEARRFVGVVEEIAEPHDLLAQVLRNATDARLLARGGDAAAAAKLSALAVGYAEQSDFPWLQARTLLAASEVAARGSDDAAARELVERARDVFAAKGNAVAARRLAAQTSGALLFLTPPA